MSSIAVAITSIMMLVLVAVMAPNILAMNRGKILRNTAIWLAIFVGLGLIYKAMHPGAPPLVTQAPASPAKQGEPATASHDNNGNEGFTPPKEE